MHWPDPAQRTRIVEIRDNLIDRIAEADREGWLGEVEGLNISLAGANDKLAQLDRRSPTTTTVNLGMPSVSVNRRPGPRSLVQRIRKRVILHPACRHHKIRGRAELRDRPQDESAAPRGGVGRPCFRPNPLTSSGAAGWSAWEGSCRRRPEAWAVRAYGTSGRIPPGTDQDSSSPAGLPASLAAARPSVMPR